MPVSVLMATYNHEDFVRRTLLGLSRQSVKDFELIVCDDGSREELRRTVTRVCDEHGMAHRILTQPDQGFRKCRILNAGVLASTCDYLVFLDADCIPHRHFVAGHLARRKPGSCLAGRRVMLGERLTKSVDDDWILSGRLDRLSWRMPTGRARHLDAGMHLSGYLAGLVDFGRPRLKGCNFSCWKKDMERINGFEESFVTPGGGEDDDVERRLALAGVRMRSVKHSAVCFHQYHPVVPRGTAGLDLCRELAARGNTEAVRGLREHAGESGA
jgi:glycosyltransferase involved in cell wall biosynthesis